MSYYEAVTVPSCFGREFSPILAVVRLKLLLIVKADRRDCVQIDVTVSSAGQCYCYFRRLSRGTFVTALFFRSSGCNVLDANLRAV